MSVSSKWYVTKIDGPNVYLHPVVRGVENRSWASATPGGSMSMHITNPEALAQFVLYEEYTGLFEHSPKPRPHDGHAVEQIEQKPTYDGGKTYYVCGVCSSYASLNEDGTPNWAKHEEMFAPLDEDAPAG